MKNPYLKIIITAFLTLGLSISLQSTIAAWQPPVATAPQGNPEGFINSGVGDQTKDGGLSLGGSLNSNDLFVASNIAINSSIDSNSSELLILDERITPAASLYIAGSSTIPTNPEIDLADGAGNHWGMYLNQGDSNSFNLWYGGVNRFVIGTNGQAVLTTMEDHGFTVHSSNDQGEIHIAGPSDLGKTYSALYLHDNSVDLDNNWFFANKNETGTFEENDLDIGRYDAGVARYDITIDSVTGNVGIGINNPNEKLDVQNGNIELSKGYSIDFGQNDATKVYTLSADDKLYVEAENILGVAQFHSYGLNLPLDVATGLNVRGGAAFNQGTGNQILLKNDGTVNALAFIYNSDKTLKTKIETIDNATEKLLQINGVNFTWKESGRDSIGVIAQDVEKVFPELVHTNEEGIKAVEYGNLVAPLIETIRELDERIKVLEYKLEQ